MVSAVEDSQAIGFEAEVGFESEVQITLIGSEQLHRDSLRLDAGYYNIETTRAHHAMATSGLPMKKLGDVTERIFIPPRFKRVYVDEAHGVPFLQGSHLAHFRPADLKYISRSAYKNLSAWTIKAGWVLFTRSGTIGRAAIALKEWDGWTASEHIIRVVPKTDGACPAGYIYAWLSSPLGQAQFNGIYGAVVDELTPSHVENILIPIPETGEQREAINSINAQVMDVVAMKEQALEKDALAVKSVDLLVPQHIKVSPRGVQIPYIEQKHRAHAIYNAQIRHLIAPANQDKYVMIDILTGDYEIGENRATLIRLLRNRHPDAVMHTIHNHQSYRGRIRSLRTVRKAKAIS